ncbi:RNB domain-containing ribonuclease [Melaminivora jejuensis]|uniref:ribonuclease catalytic domain-containing protein n=1 Tax=Melaminivora jejuensis TaxID=1267217 RepID=UPI001E5AD24F|nr:ribonuclease catalytic domain-containing protein [Melaminivora jejuensis]UHJ65533.1 RNB domain-containing ribonuclease [Melaminivora jejuensis]
MHALFDEAGKFLAGRILSEAESSAQIELDSGKRVKVKTANILLRFDKPAPAELLAGARALAAEIELPLAWEFAPEDEFGFAELAREYFSAAAPPMEQAAMLLALFEAPHYFRRAGKGRFKKASAEVVQQALAAIEKKRQLQEQIDAWAGELVAGRCPQPVLDQLYRILFKPDKNAPEYKAVVEASRAAQLAPLALLSRAGAIQSSYQFHWQRFLFDFFPRGTGFAPLAAPEPPQELPLADVQAFSIDDSATTEIDDALSLTGLGSGTVRLGIHIAAPGLAIEPGGELDRVARTRLSTVYMPGHKITMLPHEVVQRYTLDEGRANPAVSLYVSIDEATLAITGHETLLERVPVSVNLRHDQLDHIVTEDWLAHPEIQIENTPQALSDLREQLSFLHRLARQLKLQREEVRGKPETFSRPDYSFRLHGVAGDEPDGSERVEISTRRRGAPLDLIVAEAAIVANSTWGELLADYGVPGIYRSQASLAPGVKVRMSTRALPHAGIGVKSYAWATSPLRRYVDLVNQWQVIACARHGKTAALAAPFKPKDAELFAIISSFEGTYSAYNAYQSSMERLWTLKYLQQNAIAELDATVIRDANAGGLLLRADTLPLVLPALGPDSLTRGARVRVRLGEIDEISLDVHGTVLARLDDPLDASDDGPVDDDEGEGEAVAGPIAIAVDVQEGDGAPAAPAAPASA